MAWVPKPHAEDHAARHGDGGADELDAADLASGAAADGHVLTADGAGAAAWEAVPTDALDDLSDVTITTPSTGEVLKYNGSGWVNDTDDTGSGLPTASTKGDIAVYNGSAWVIVAAGANDTVLTADSAQSAGVKWAAGASGGGGLLGSAVDETTRSYTALNTWEDISGASVTFTAPGSVDVVVRCTVRVRGTSTNWRHILHRLLLNSATTGVSPTQWSEAINSNANSSHYSVISFAFILSAPSAASHTVKLQTHDSNTGLDREYTVTLVEVTS